MLIGTAFNGSTLASTTLYNSVNITSTLPVYYFHVNANSLVSKFIPTDILSQLAISVASAATAASVTGADNPTSLIYSALEDTSMPSWFQSAVPVTYSTQIATLEAQINNLRADLLGSTVGPTSSVVNGTTSSSSTSRAWIAGAVIGPVAGISLILLGMFLLRHRRLAKNQAPHESDIITNEKPELHADSLPAPRVYEMDGMQDSIELEVSEAPQELPAEGLSKTPT
ncbi:hypothetical protein VSDG_03616 [Cytospora chrysosperma]|uniref:Mid2 domain-containing protein n=1 Tax=Cytospora chrysosperma TaxID=252740 RepID=A0A423WA02_CYTCH|nr:hypothetical protein VSDG_03616 [Valsa sordida]